MIPIIINNFNWYSTTKKLVEDLIRLGYTNIHILDNGSTYPPLLEWYNSLDTVHVEYLNRNVGPRALWDSGYIKNFQHLDWIAYTDSDIELHKHCPEDFIEILTKVAEGRQFNKVGLALDIYSLDPVAWNDVIYWEEKYWNKCIDVLDEDNKGYEAGVFEADIDTTFAVIKPQLPFDYKALRVTGNFTAKHKPWYVNFDNMTEEESYIMERLDPAHSTLRRYYNTHLENKKSQ